MQGKSAALKRGSSRAAQPSALPFFDYKRRDEIKLMVRVGVYNRLSMRSRLGSDFLHKPRIQNRSLFGCIPER